MIKNEFDPSRRRMFKRAIAVGVGAVISGTILRAQPARAAKASKAVAMYQDKPHGDQKCDGCIHFVPGKTAEAAGTCQLVEGSISPQGWCVLFAPKV